MTPLPLQLVRCKLSEHLWISLCGPDRTIKQNATYCWHFRTWCFQTVSEWFYPCAAQQFFRAQAASSCFACLSRSSRSFCSYLKKHVTHCDTLAGDLCTWQCSASLRVARLLLWGSLGQCSIRRNLCSTKELHFSPFFLLLSLLCVEVATSSCEAKQTRNAE